MINALYDYFVGLFYGSGQHYVINLMTDTSFTIGGYDYELGEYLSLTCSIISLILILVLCCLFIYRLIRLVGRLFSGGAL